MTYALMYSAKIVLALFSPIKMFGLLTLRSKDPGNSPSWQAEALGKTINDKNIVLVDIVNVLCC